MKTNNVHPFIKALASIGSITLMTISLPELDPQLPESEINIIGLLTFVALIAFCIVSIWPMRSRTKKQRRMSRIKVFGALISAATSLVFYVFELGDKTAVRMHKRVVIGNAFTTEMAHIVDSTRLHEPGRSITTGWLLDQVQFPKDAWPMSEIEHNSHLLFGLYVMFCFFLSLSILYAIQLVPIRKK